MIDPTNPENILTLGKDEFEALSQKAKLAGGSLRFTKSTRKVYRQAYLGNVLLEVGDAPCKGHFSFKCMTGKRDRNKNTFFGIVRAMKDPARWSNKWMSQTMHIMNTTAKGGIAVERGQFFDDDAQGEASWAHQDQVTRLKPGALSGANPKIIAKPVSQFPQGSFELMQYANQSHRDVSGVNVEILGMQGFVVDFNQLGRVLGLEVGLGDDHCDVIADVAHLALREHGMRRLFHRLAVHVGDQPAAGQAVDLGIGSVFAGEYGDDTRAPACFRRIDAG